MQLIPANNPTFFMKESHITHPDPGNPHFQEFQWISEALRDMRQFRPLYDAFYKDVYIFVHRRCMHQQHCMDIVSRVFEKAMLNLGKYKYQGYSFSTWLYRIAANETADFFKQQKKEEKLWVRDEGLAEMMAEMNEDAGKEEKIEMVLNALADLERSERELIVMRFFEKRAYAEIASIQNQSENYLRVKLNRILNKIKTSTEGRNK
jgi:RNA polymerase sigma-70 factor (ECF subfamily)